MARRQERRRWAFVSSIAVVCVVSLLGGLWFVVRERKLKEGMTQAWEQLHRGGPSALARAEIELQKNLEILGSHLGSLCLRDLVEARRGLAQASMGSSVLSVEGEGRDCVGSLVARSIEYHRLGRWDEAYQFAEAASTAAAGPDQEVVVRWLQLHLARNGPGLLLPEMAENLQRATTTPAELGDVAETRARAAMAMRRGDLSSALNILDSKIEELPEGVGLLVDRLLYAEFGGTSVVDDWRRLAAMVADRSLTPHDSARLELASGWHRLSEGGPQAGDDARQAFERALQQVPAWDAETRQFVLSTSLVLGRPNLALVLANLSAGGERRIDPRVESFYRAWVAALGGRHGDATGELAELVDSPRVALVRALGKIEQGLLDDARRLLPAAGTSGAEEHLRRLLTLRLGPDVDDGRSALETMESRMGEFSWMWRSWTTLGELRLGKDSSNPPLPASTAAAKIAFEKALEREATPAEAALQLAIFKSREDKFRPERGLAALALFERAATASPSVPRYVGRFGLESIRRGLFGEGRALLIKSGVRNLNSTQRDEIVVIEAQHAEFEHRAMSAQDYAWLDPEVGSTSSAASDSGMGLVATASWLVGSHPRDFEVRAAQCRAAIEAELAVSEVEPRLRVELHLAEAALGAQLDETQVALDSLRRALRRVPKKGLGYAQIRVAIYETHLGVRRRAAARAWKGWKSMRHESWSAAHRLVAAEAVASMWLAIKQEGPARSVARGLTEDLPYLADAWAFRAHVQRKTEHLVEACKSVHHALLLRPAHPVGAAILAKLTACSAP